MLLFYKLHEIKGKIKLLMMISVLTTDMQFNSVLEVFTLWLNNVMTQLQQSQHEYERNKQEHGTNEEI